MSEKDRRKHRIGRPTAAPEWSARLARLPPGLCVDEAARRLGVSRQTAYPWIRRLGYVTGKAPGRYDARWAAVDWSQPNSVIAKRLGVTQEAVRWQRAVRKLPPSRSGIVSRIRPFVEANRERLHGRPVAEIAAELGEQVSPGTLRAALTELGVRLGSNKPGRPSTFPPCNWDLPSTVLAAIWRVPVQQVTDHRPSGHRAKWYLRNAKHVTDPAYPAAVATEKGRARSRRVPRRPVQRRGRAGGDVPVRVPIRAGVRD
jgi:hypothetical protein